jgi:hypothetical protein
VSKPQILRGPALVDALTATVHQVKWLLPGWPNPPSLPADAALAIVTAEAEYFEGKARPGGRVYYIRDLRDVDHRAPNDFDPAFWNGRAVIRFHGGPGDDPRIRTREQLVQRFEEIYGKISLARATRRSL